MCSSSDLRNVWKGDFLGMHTHLNWKIDISFYPQFFHTKLNNIVMFSWKQALERYLY